MNIQSYPSRTSWYAALLLGIALTVALTALSATGAWSAPAAKSATSGASAQATTARTAASSPITNANKALAQAVLELRRHHPRRAVTFLRRLNVQISQAHTTAVNLIGKPPTDPESDEPPGPAAVLGVLGLDHRVTMTTVPLFRNHRGPLVVSALRSTLGVTHVRRNAMIAKVVALPPEGAGDDYADGMSDILPQFPAEVSRIKTALASYRLTTTGRVGLTVTRNRVVAAQTMMNKAYGGGE
jgi:hypothetical protein